MDNKLILLVEDNPDDELLAKRALRKNKISSEAVIVRDGQYARHDTSISHVIFLILNDPSLMELMC